MAQVPQREIARPVRKRRALWFDDYPETIRDYVEAMRWWGFSVRQVGDRESALTWLARSKYDIVILDLRIEEEESFDGVELAEQGAELQTGEEGPEVPFVAVSNFLNSFHEEALDDQFVRRFNKARLDSHVGRYEFLKEIDRLTRPDALRSIRSVLGYVSDMDEDTVAVRVVRGADAADQVRYLPRDLMEAAGITELAQPVELEVLHHTGPVPCVVVVPHALGFPKQKTRRTIIADLDCSRFKE